MKYVEGPAFFFIERRKEMKYFIVITERQIRNKGCECFYELLFARISSRIITRHQNPIKYIYILK